MCLQVECSGERNRKVVCYKQDDSKCKQNRGNDNLAEEVYWPPCTNRHWVKIVGYTQVAKVFGVYILRNDRYDKKRSGFYPAKP